MMESQSFRGRIRQGTAARKSIVSWAISQVCLVALLMGCSASTSPNAVAPVGSTSTPSEPHSPVPTYENNLRLRRDVMTTSCRATPRGWTAAGAIRSTQKVAHRFLLTVAFTDNVATVLSEDQASVNVAPSHSARWSVASKLHEESGILCVLVGVQ